MTKEELIKKARQDFLDAGSKGLVMTTQWDFYLFLQRELFQAGMKPLTDYREVLLYD